MSTLCNCPNNIPCNHCSQTPCVEIHCECPVLLKTDCITNVTVDLPCLNVKKGKTLNEWMLAVDTALCAKFLAIQNYFSIVNVGAGVGKLYAGLNIFGEKKIKSIKGTALIDITNSTVTEDVEVAVNQIALTTFVNNLIPNTSLYESTNVGTGLGLIFKNKVANVFNFRKIKTENTGTGESILNTELTDLINDNIVISAKKLKTNNLQITSDTNSITIDFPEMFQGTEYYVNTNYGGLIENGRRATPFRTLKKCFDKILNRGTQNDGINPVKNKWDNLPISRIIIQSQQDIDENIAINNTIYKLEDSTIQHIGTDEYVLDMRLLVNNAPKTASTLNYGLQCTVIGNGRLLNSNVNRKGVVFCNGYNNGTNNFQNESNVLLGDENSNIVLEVIRNTNLNYIPLTNGANENQALGTPIIREGINMLGYQTTSTPNFGLITIEGANKPYGSSLKLSGNIKCGYFEQHMIYCKNGGFFGNDGSLYIQRSYQFINYSNIEEIARDPTTPSITNKYYKPSKHVSDIYLDASNCSYSGLIYTQQNTGSNQGGSESFITLKNKSYSILSNSQIKNLFYNHFIKVINLSSYGNYESSQIELNNYNFSSLCFEHLYDIVNEDTLGVETANTQFLSNTSFHNCYFNNIWFGLIRKFTNKIINTNLLLNQVLGVFLATGYFAPSMITCLDNNDALSKNLQQGNTYKTSIGDLKIVY